MELSEAEVERYARQIVLPEVGGRGQSRLKAASVLVVGAGGLGAPLLLYLAAAGVGRLGLVDDDAVDLSNLQRQVLFTEADIGAAKVEAAAARLRALNAEILIEPHRRRLNAENVDRLVAAYDLVADGSDNLATRRLVHDACMRQDRPLVAAAVQGTDGQIATWKGYLGAPHPCMRCLLDDEVADGFLPSCAQGGVLGPAVGAVGAMQAVEVVKELLGVGAGLSGRMLLYDALAAETTTVRVRRRVACDRGCTRMR